MYVIVNNLHKGDNKHNNNNNNNNNKAKVVLVKTGATGTILKSLRQYLSNILGKGEMKEMQKKAKLDTGHELREVLMCNYKTSTCE